MNPPATPQPTLVLDRVLRVLQPLVRLLLRGGVTYPVFAAALKRVFLDAARAELSGRGMAQTDSAITLLCGVHRRDVRNLSRAAPEAAPPPPLGLAAQVVARWMNEPAFVGPRGRPLPLPKSGNGASFDNLVAGVSRDVRPRAVLDELLRLGVVREDEGAAIVLAAAGFAPRQGFEEMSWLMAANLQDHAAAAVANLQGEVGFLEQALFVDQISADSAHQLHQAATAAWRQAFQAVMPLAQARFDADAALPAEQRRHRARFGVYFFSEKEE
jgi:hypothetical protein